MKKKTLLPLAILAMALLSACESPQRRANALHTPGRLRVDTLEIHGNTHEVVFWLYEKEGGMMHSPECWCKKGGQR